MTGKTLKAGLLVAGVAAALGVAVVAQAQQSQVEARQNGMKAQGAAVRTLTPIIRGEQPWNQEVVVAQLTALNNSSKRIPTAFTEQGGNALPAIWQNKADFDAKAKNLETVTASLLQLAQANNEAGFKAAAPQLGQACAGCHTPYRKPQQ